MYQPELCVRAEIAQTDADTLREWHVVIGGAQRGGMAMTHGYMPTSGPILADAIDDIVWNIRQILEAYAVGLGGLESKLPL